MPVAVPAGPSWTKVLIKTLREHVLMIKDKTPEKYKLIGDIAAPKIIEKYRQRLMRHGVQLHVGTHRREPWRRYQNVVA
eukprot:9248809-Heterocapsa_arctica.AAC.1